MKTIVRTRPYRDFAEMNDMLEQMFSEFWGQNRGDGHMMPLDVLENDDTMIFRASVPGIDPANIDISIEDNVLTLKGETSNVEESKDVKVYRREITRGTFTRSIRLPENLNLDEANAEFQNGLMTITIPRLEKPKKTIQVQVRQPAIEAKDQSSE